jgi:hypothetical protein
MSVDSSIKTQIGTGTWDDPIVQDFGIPMIMDNNMYTLSKMYNANNQVIIVKNPITKETLQLFKDVEPICPNTAEGTYHTSFGVISDKCIEINEEKFISVSIYCKGPLANIALIDIFYNDYKSSGVIQGAGFNCKTGYNDIEFKYSELFGQGFFNMVFVPNNTAHGYALSIAEYTPSYKTNTKHRVDSNAVFINYIGSFIFKTNFIKSNNCIQNIIKFGVSCYYSFYKDTITYLNRITNTAIEDYIYRESFDYPAPFFYADGTCDYPNCTTGRVYMYDSMSLDISNFRMMGTLLKPNIDQKCDISISEYEKKIFLQSFKTDSSGIFCIKPLSEKYKLNDSFEIPFFCNNNNLKYAVFTISYDTDVFDINITPSNSFDIYIIEPEFNEFVRIQLNDNFQKLKNCKGVIITIIYKNTIIPNECKSLESSINKTTVFCFNIKFTLKNLIVINNGVYNRKTGFSELYVDARQQYFKYVNSTVIKMTTIIAKTSNKIILNESTLFATYMNDDNFHTAFSLKGILIKYDDTQQNQIQYFRNIIPILPISSQSGNSLPTTQATTSTYGLNTTQAATPTQSPTSTYGLNTTQSPTTSTYGLITTQSATPTQSPTTSTYGLNTTQSPTTSTYGLTPTQAATLTQSPTSTYGLNTTQAATPTQSPTSTYGLNTTQAATPIQSPTTSTYGLNTTQAATPTQATTTSRALITKKVLPTTKSKIVIKSLPKFSPKPKFLLKNKPTPKKLILKTKQSFTDIKNFSNEVDNSLSIGEITNIIICGMIILILLILLIVIIYKFILKRKIPHLRYFFR